MLISSTFPQPEAFKASALSLSLAACRPRIHRPLRCDVCSSNLALGSRLVMKLDDSSATVRSWTNGQLASLRGKTLVTSPLVTFTQAWH
eukprot:4500198-Pleurochrysis_carterae.AAC.1